MNVGRYRKAIAAAAAAAAEIARVSADGSITLSEGVGIAVLVLGVLGVYQATNDPA